jgi:uncharacterized protein YjbI with pentapeptide repeats
MRIYRDTPFEFSYMPWEIQPPQTTLMIVVKGAFTIVPDGECTIAEEQVPCEGEVPWEDGDPPSLQLEGDYAVFKPRGEWYFKGSAKAAGGQPATLVPVSVRVGQLSKQLAVWGDRHWKLGLLGSTPSEPAPFVELPLRWERSAGGPRVAANPVGIGSRTIQTERGSFELLPNIEDPNHPCVSKDDLPPPAGMFPIPGRWKERSGKTGTYDELWKASRWPYFPRNFDFEFFQCAPRDQRKKEGYWRGDEEIELSGVSAEHPRIRTRLPSLTVRCFLECTGLPPGFSMDEVERTDQIRSSVAMAGMDDAEPDEDIGRSTLLEVTGPPALISVRMHLDTIAVDADRMLVLCQWRGLAPVANDRLSNVDRLFYVHERLDEPARPMAHYEAWLQRKLLEEANEFEDDAEEGVNIPTLPDDAAEREAEEKGAEVIEKGIALLAAAAGEEERDPSIAEARAALEEAGIEVPEDLVEPEPLEPPEDAAPPSLRRLVAIVRRRLGKPMRDMDLSNAPFQNLDLSGVDFTNAILTGADLTGATLAGATLDGAILARARLNGADLLRASLRGADLTEAECDWVRFEGAALDLAGASRATFTNSRFAEASFAGAYFDACTFTACDFRGAILDGGTFIASGFESCDFTRASLADVSLESVKAPGCVFERARMPKLRASDGADFSGASFVLVEAPGAQFQESIVAGANFSGSNLEGADFSDARAAGANFTRCVLRGACFDHGKLEAATMIQADLFEASFQHADLARADLRGAHLFSADLFRAVTRGALLEQAELGRTLLEGR